MGSQILAFPACPILVGRSCALVCLRSRRGSRRRKRPTRSKRSSISTWGMVLGGYRLVALRLPVPGLVSRRSGGYSDRGDVLHRRISGWLRHLHGHSTLV